METPKQSLALKSLQTTIKMLRQVLRITGILMGLLLNYRLFSATFSFPYTDYDDSSSSIQPEKKQPTMEAAIVTLPSPALHVERNTANNDGPIFPVIEPALMDLPTPIPGQAPGEGAAGEGGRFDFRLNWSNVGLQSRLAQQIDRGQRGCSNGWNTSISSSITSSRTPQSMRFHIREQNPSWGVGNNYFKWSTFLCTAQMDSAMLLFRGDFSWTNGLDECDAAQTQHIGAPNGTGYSYMQCFFPKDSTTTCTTMNRNGQEQQVLPPKDKEDARVVKDTVLGKAALNNNHRKLGRLCDIWLKEQGISLRDWRAASMNWLFRSVSDRVLQEGHRQIRQAFPEGLPTSEDLVTAHVRWGDKISAGGYKRIEIHEYIAAIHKIVGPRANDTRRTLHIYVASEDAEARRQFDDQKPAHWVSHKSGPIANATRMANIASGLTGLQSMGALLLSMEANYYVLTTKSLWSALINALRPSLDMDHISECQQCTHMIDLNAMNW